MVGQLIRIIGSLGLFIYGMKVLSEAIRRAAGDRLRSVLQFITANRFAAVATGFVLTVLVQSSSASTVMIVSFVNASLLTLVQAIGAIMGANIGTTVTGWIVAVFGFRVDVSAAALPAIGLGAVLLFSKRLRRTNEGEALIGFGILFLGLNFLRSAVPDVSDYPGVLEWFAGLTGRGPLSVVIFVLFGGALTVLVQSSSAAVAITLTMAYAGWIDYPTAAAVILGENIGTTITANLAAIGGSRNGTRAARAHLLFNVFGVAWMFFAFPFFLTIVDRIVPGDPYASALALPTHLAMFHSLFNVVNTLLCVWFVPMIARIVTRLVHGEDLESFDTYTAPLATQYVHDSPELYLVEIRHEAIRMASISRDVLELAWTLLGDPKRADESEIERLRLREEYTDQMERELTSLLATFSTDTLSRRSAEATTSLLRIIDELESIADSGFNIGLLAERANRKKHAIEAMALEELDDYYDRVVDFVRMIERALTESAGPELFEQAVAAEKRINKRRNVLKKHSRRRIQKGADVRQELLAIDVIGHLEHVGDHCLNIAEAVYLMDRHRQPDAGASTRASAVAATAAIAATTPIATADAQPVSATSAGPTRGSRAD